MRKHFLKKNNKKTKTKVPAPLIDATNIYKILCSLCLFKQFIVFIVCLILEVIDTYSRKIVNVVKRRKNTQFQPSEAFIANTVSFVQTYWHVRVY